MISKEIDYLKTNTQLDQHQAIDQAARILTDLVSNDNFEEFLTTPAYELIK